MTAAKNSKPDDIKPSPAVVVFGLDEAHKAHAAWFSADDAELAERAAGFMQMKAMKLTTDEHRAAAQGLPQGRVFASGRGFVPFCKRAAYEALTAFPEAFEPPAPAEPEAAPVPAVVNVPAGRSEVGVGSLVLATEGPAQGWFECVVAEERGEGILVLAWRDFPDSSQVVRRVEHLAFVPPAVLELV